MAAMYRCAARSNARSFASMSASSGCRGSTSRSCLSEARASADQGHGTQRALSGSLPARVPMASMTPAHPR